MRRVKIEEEAAKGTYKQLVYLLQLFRRCCKALSAIVSADAFQQEFREGPHRSS